MKASDINSIIEQLKAIGAQVKIYDESFVELQLGELVIDFDLTYMRWRFEASSTAKVWENKLILMIENYAQENGMYSIEYIPFLVEKYSQLVTIMNA